MAPSRAIRRSADDSLIPRDHSPPHAATRRGLPLSRWGMLVLLLLSPHLSWVLLLPGRSEAGEGPAPQTAVTRPPFAEAIDKAQKRCVKLFGEGIAREHGYATGIVVSADGRVLTADGIYLAGRNLKAVFPDGSESQVSIVRKSKELQLALLQLDRPWPEHFELVEKPLARQGDWCMAVANPFKVAGGAEPLSVNMGIVSIRLTLDAKRKRREIPYEGDLLLIDAITGNPGAPGGALIGADGSLLGMVGRVIESESTNTRLNYAVPADRLWQFLQNKDAEKPTQAEGEPAGKPCLGIRLLTLSGKRAPAYIDRILPNSPAADSGLQKDDLVITLAGEVIRNCGEYEEAERKLTSGEEVTLVVKRNLTIRQFKIKVSEKK